MNITRNIHVFNSYQSQNKNQGERGGEEGGGGLKDEQVHL